MKLALIEKFGDPSATICPWKFIPCLFTNIGDCWTETLPLPGFHQEHVMVAMKSHFPHSTLEAPKSLQTSQRTQEIYDCETIKILFQKLTRHSVHLLIY